MAYKVTAYIVMAYIVMAYIVMAQTVEEHRLPPTATEAVRSAEAKLSPEIVTTAPTVVAELWASRYETTAESKLKAESMVPTT